MNVVEKYQKLPLELACVFIGNNKQTADSAKGLWHFMGKEQAREFYREDKIMDSTTFDSVNWEDLWDTLALKPKIYQLWF